MKQLPKLSPLLIVLIVFGCQSANPPAAEKSANRKENPAQELVKPQLKLVHQVNEPENEMQDAPLLVLLHGRGSNESVFISMAPNLDRRLRVVSVQGPIKMGEGRFAWFDLQRNSDGLRRYEGAEVLSMSDRLVAFIEAFVSHHELEPKQIFIGGFSQGAIMSLGTGLRHPKVVDGVLCFSGALYPEFLTDVPLSAEQKELSILVTHGKKDIVLPFAEIELAVNQLKSKGLETTFKQYDSAHTFPPENFRDFREWLVQELDGGQKK